MCNKADNSCRQEKLGCKGCFYNICNDEEKKAIEYLKARLYGNEGCELIDVAQSDLRIIIKLVDRVLKADKNCQEILDEESE